MTTPDVARPARASGEAADGASDKANVIAPPPLIFAAALAIGWLCRRADSRPILPTAIAPRLGAGLCAASLAIAGFALYELHRARTPVDPRRATTALVQTGPYRLSRNPLYVALTALYLGIAAWRNSLWIGLFAVPALVVMRFGVIAREERYLDRKFGDEYRRYRAKVRRWL